MLCGSSDRECCSRVWVRKVGKSFSTDRIPITFGTKESISLDFWGKTFFATTSILNTVSLSKIMSNTVANCVASPGFLFVCNNFLFDFPGLIGACSGVAAVVTIAEVVTVESSSEYSTLHCFDPTQHLHLYLSFHRQSMDKNLHD